MPTVDEQTGLPGATLPGRTAPGGASAPPPAWVGRWLRGPERKALRGPARKWLRGPGPPGLGGVMERIVKDPESTEAFRVPWTRRLGGAVISGVETTVSPAGQLAVLDTQLWTADVVQSRLTGGVAGETYQVRQEITTSDGQTLFYTFEVEARAE